MNELLPVWEQHRFAAAKSNFQHTPVAGVLTEPKQRIIRPVTGRLKIAIAKGALQVAHVRYGDQERPGSDAL